MRKVIQLTEQDFKQEDGFKRYISSNGKLWVVIEPRANRIDGHIGIDPKKNAQYYLTGKTEEEVLQEVNKLLNKLYLTFTEEQEPCDKKQTNREYLNSLSDEDFAEQMDFQCMGQCEFAVGWKCIPDRDDYSDSKKCIVGRTRWLQAEREEV